MATVDLVQRSDAWFEWRKQGITASMIPVIMGLSSYQTPYQLWAELVGLKEPDDLSNNYHVQRGVEQEPEAREAVEQEVGRPYLPVCVEADHNPLFKASLDGLYQSGSDMEVLEIKCPCEKIYNEILELKAHSPTFLMYAAQVQWQLNCSGATKGKLYFYLRGKRPVSTTIFRNEAFIKEAEDAALSFWNWVQTQTPPPLVEKDKVVYDIDKTDEWSHKVKSYTTKSKELAELEALVKQAKAEIKTLEQYFTSKIPDDVQSFEQDGIRATRVERKGSVNYKNLIADIEQQMDFEVPQVMMDRHTKAGTTYFRVSVIDDVEPQPESNVATEQAVLTPPEAFLDATNTDVRNEQTANGATEKPVAPAEIAKPREARSYFEKSSNNVFF